MILILLALGASLFAFSKGDTVTAALDAGGLVLAARPPPAKVAGNAVSNRGAKG
jgi:hypothetical protein